MIDGLSRFGTVLRWTAAALIVLAVHAGAVGLSVLSMSDAAEDDGMAGAFIVELAPVAAAPADAPENIAPGAPSADSAEALAVAQQEKVDVPLPEEDLPPLPQLAEAPPDLMLPEPVPDRPKEPAPEEPEKQKQDDVQTASEARSASVAAAPPKIEDAPPADKPVAPTVGLTPQQVQAQSRWQTALAAHLNRHKRFPAAAAGLHGEVRVLVRFTIDRMGQAMLSELVESSGSPALDEEAKTLIVRASPFPLPPVHLTGNVHEFVVPIVFRLQN